MSRKRTRSHINSEYLDNFEHEKRHFLLQRPIATTLDGSYVNPTPGSRGVYWSKHEKEIFFQCLGRYSIHRLDVICEHLPNKSMNQVLEYYDTLKDSETLITREDVPIAYEVSEEFVKMEESLAFDLDEKEKQYKGKLADFSRWNSRWYKVYSRLRMAQYQPVCKVPPRLGLEAGDLLETAAVRYLYDVMRRIIVKANESKLVTDRELMPILVKPDMVKEALQGLRPTNLTDSAAETLDKFNFKLSDKKPTELIRKPYYAVRLPQEGKCKEDERLQKALYNKSLHNVPGFVVDDKYNLVDNKIAEELFEYDNQLLEEADMAASVRYERVLLEQFKHGDNQNLSKEQIEKNALLNQLEDELTATIEADWNDPEPLVEQQEPDMEYTLTHRQLQFLHNMYKHEFP